MSEEKKDSIFKKVMGATEGWLDAQVIKAKNSAKSEFDMDLEYQKSVDHDEGAYVGAQGYKEKSYRITFEHLRQMSLKDSIVSSVIQTRQNQVASHSKLIRNQYEKGFKIVLENEELIREYILELISQGFEDVEIINLLKKSIEDAADSIIKSKTNKKDKTKKKSVLECLKSAAYEKLEVLRKADNEEIDPEAAQAEEDSAEWKKYRRANKILKEATADRKKYLEEFIINCGVKEKKPFKAKKWNFDSFLRAVVRDSLTYDLLAVEIVRSKAGKPIYFVPVDGSTVKFASPQLGQFQEFPLHNGYDILYPEKELQNLERKDALKLDKEKLEKNEYKYVQVVKGKIERGFTQDELKIGMRNPTTDIYNNGYSISELELLVMLVTSHLNAEYYNQAYFTQGFSAKGILHIKAPLNKRKLLDIRQKWQHMIKGSKNSFQTPIFAGADEVKWIPLTQSHSDIEFQGWMLYLLKMICSIYQIDPQEIGAGIKEEGSKGNGLSGDNTKEKIDLSRDRGLYPLVRFLENFINESVIKEIDSDFKLEFVGIKDETQKDAIERQSKESKFKKTVNEIRAEEGLPPIPGADMLILDAMYMQWYQQFSPEGKKARDERDINQQTSDILNNPIDYPPEVMATMDEETQKSVKLKKALSNPIKIEYYKLK